MLKCRQIFLLLPLLSALLIGTTGCGGEVSPTVEEIPSLDGERINNFYTNEEIAYLLEIGLWGDTSLLGVPIIRRWRSDIRIGTKGSPTPEDLAALHAAAAQLDGLARELSIAVERSDSVTPNVTVYFIPRGAFGFIQPDYTYPDFGFTGLPSDSVIRGATVLVATDSTSQQERNTLIYRGLAASLGLTNRSSTYPQSIFHSGTIAIPESGYNPIDRTIVELLYSSEIWAGMKRDDVIRLLSTR